ncbi:MAG: hypothetical protein O3B08_01395 [Proteobacteria bacterium]|nr:hypothetical protein [Pseudomonadota bacterium]
MSETSWSNPAIWTSTAAAAIAAGVVAVAVLAWIIWIRRKSVRRQHRTANRQSRFIAQF